MKEYLLFSITGINTIVTILLTFVILYWIFVILGFVSQDMLDFNFDIDRDFDIDGDFDFNNSEQVEIDNSGFFRKFLEFAHMDTIPFMVYITIYICILWILTMLTYYFPFSPKSFMSFILLLINMNASLIVTKGLTKPLLPFFQGLEDDCTFNPIGKRAIMQTSLEPNRLGQALIKRGNGSEILLNVISNEKHLFKKDIVQIIEEVEERDVYLVIKLYEREE